MTGAAVNGDPATFWNGERANCAQGSGIVDGQRIRVVRVFAGGGQFDLDDTDQRAWSLVTSGHGSTGAAPRTVIVEPHTLVPDSWAPLLQEFFDRQGIETETS